MWQLYVPVYPHLYNYILYNLSSLQESLLSRSNLFKYIKLENRETS
jgi:hypothetical protein